MFARLAKGALLAGCLGTLWPVGSAADSWKHGTWRLRCEPDETTKEVNCRLLTLRDFDQKGSSAFISLMVSYVPDLLVRVIIVGPPSSFQTATLQIDDLPPHTTECIWAICEWRSEDLLDEMTAGSRVQAHVDSATCCAVDIEFSLSGFEAGLQQLREMDADARTSAADQ